MNQPHRQPLACILPPNLLLRVLREGTAEQRDAILDTLALDASLRQVRAERVARMASLSGHVGVPPRLGTAAGHPQRTIYDQQHSEAETPGTLVRAEGGPAVQDPAVNEAYDGFGATYDLYWQVFERDSIDNHGMPIQGLVHYGTNYDNAFWDGNGHMFFGDGDGQILTRTTKSLDVIGHELTHGVTQYTANLVYSGQSGALNESLSDVFGSLVRQHAHNQDAASADWLIGAEIVGPVLQPALRSMKDPGQANPHDDQPADMDHYVHTTSDNGGVHTNSGIPNHAFYVVATTIGGYAWEAAGHIWYAAMQDPHVHPTATFRAFARATLRQAQHLYGTSSKEADAVRTGWTAVKVTL